MNSIFRITLDKVFPSEIFFEIVKHTSLYDALNFAVLLPWIKIEDIKDFFLKNATYNLKKKLYDIGWTDSIFSYLKSSESYIAGSYPLQCVINNFWSESDIDIFAPIIEREREPEIIKIFFKDLPHKFEALSYYGFSDQAKKYCILCNQAGKFQNHDCNHDWGVCLRHFVVCFIPSHIPAKNSAAVAMEKFLISY